MILTLWEEIKLANSTIKFRFFFGYFPQCWSVWAQPSLLFQSISKCWGLSPVTGLGTADSVYRVGYSQCAQANITKTEWIFDEDVTCFSICLHKDVSLFYAFMLLVRCLIISEARRYPPVLGIRSYPLFSSLCCWKLCLKKKKNKTFDCFVWDLSPWVLNIQ